MMALFVTTAVCAVAAISCFVLAWTARTWRQPARGWLAVSVICAALAGWGLWDMLS